MLIYIGVKIELLLLVLNTIIKHKTFKDTSVWLYLTYILKGGIYVEKNNNLICIYNENKNNIQDIILKIYSEFVENELNKEFKT